MPKAQRYVESSLYTINKVMKGDGGCCVRTCDRPSLLGGIVGIAYSSSTYCCGAFLVLPLTYLGEACIGEVAANIHVLESIQEEPYETLCRAQSQRLVGHVWFYVYGQAVVFVVLIEVRVKSLESVQCHFFVQLILCDTATFLQR